MKQDQSANRIPHIGYEEEEIAITDVKITPLTYRPADGSYVHACGPVVLTKIDMSVIEIRTDQGLVGIGPGSPQTEPPRDLIGRNPFDLLAEGLSGGFDVACWDIIGKARELPVYRLLAGESEPDPHIRVYASGGVLWTYYDRGMALRSASMPGSRRPCATRRWVSIRCHHPL